jgi:hypothetical protein
LQGTYNNLPIPTTTEQLSSFSARRKTMEKYWIVQAFGETQHKYGQHYFRHPTKEEAIREAKRLTSKYGETFAVLETVACFRPPTPEAEEVELK